MQCKSGRTRAAQEATPTYTDRERNISRTQLNSVEERIRWKRKFRIIKHKRKRHAIAHLPVCMAPCTFLLMRLSITQRIAMCLFWKHAKRITRCCTKSNKIPCEYQQRTHFNQPPNRFQRAEISNDFQFAAFVYLFEFKNSWAQLFEWVEANVNVQS